MLTVHYHPTLQLHGRDYDLSHLDPFRFEVNSAKVARPLRINVRFTNHCYSELFDPARHSPDEPVIVDGKRRRRFNQDRYALSHRLPGLIRGLTDRGVHVHETASPRNWVYSVSAEFPIAGSRYHVFFDLRRTTAERRRLQDLDMVVESAYPENPDKPAPNILGRVSFLLLAGGLYMGNLVTTRR